MSANNPSVPLVQSGQFLYKRFIDGEQVPADWETITEAELEARMAAWAASFPPPPEVPVAPQVPAEVSNQQLRLALIDWGIMPSAILAQLQAMPAGADKEKALAAWEYANTFRRDHHLVGSLAAQIGLTSAQVDDLFRLAETLG